jgi:hypothetical protein
VADKLRERAFVEMTRKQYPWFPLGELVDHEKPDFLLVDGADRLGIEVTQLFQSPKHGSKFGPHVVAKFHQKVMDVADRRAQSLPPLDVLAYFDYREHLSDAQSCAEALIDFVQTHPSGTYDLLDEIPRGFSVVRIAEPFANEVPRWRCLDSGETLKASREMLADVIGEKNKLVGSYRSNVSRVWLVIACSFGEFASNFYVPSDVDAWRFEYDFDKVLLLSSESGVFDLRRLDG